MAGFRSFLYKTARLMGDVNAVLKGPGAIVRRMGRKVAGRAAGGAINKTFKPSRPFKFKK